MYNKLTPITCLSAVQFFIFTSEPSSDFITEILNNKPIGKVTHFKKKETQNTKNG